MSTGTETLGARRMEAWAAAGWFAIAGGSAGLVLEVAPIPRSRWRIAVFSGGRGPAVAETPGVGEATVGCRLSSLAEPVGGDESFSRASA